MSWKSIAVFLDDTPEGEKVCRYATDLAHRVGAHLIGIHGITGYPEEQPSDAFVRGHQAIGEVIARRRAAQDQQAIAVGRCFAALARKQDVSAEFRVIWSGHADEDAPLNLFHCDLVIVGHPTLHGLPQGWTPERLLRASGIPVLIVPHAWPADTIGNHVLVAWNVSREARRAIADALPFLSTAQSVTVLVVDSDKGAQKYGEEPGADIALYLARHGARVDVERASSDGSPIAEVILERAAKHGADLIVMGAYSHARTTEIIFGGVTRTLLTRVPIPILVSR